MRKIIFAAMVLILGVGGLSYAYDDGDFQVWNTDVEEIKLNEKTKLAFEEEFRWGDNANEFFYYHFDGGLFYALNKYWSLGDGYRQIYELKKGKFKPENAPYLTATLFLERKGFVFDSRNRFEYRHFDYQTDSWRYRNKFTLKFPWKFTKFKIQPFASDELLFTFASAKNGFNQNRFSCGLGASISKKIKAEIYYMFLSTKSPGKWNDANVLGTKIKIAF